METETSLHLLSANSRTSKVGGEIQSQYESLRTREADGLCPKVQSPSNRISRARQQGKRDVLAQEKRANGVSYDLQLHLGPR